MKPLSGLYGLAIIASAMMAATASYAGTVMKAPELGPPAQLVEPSGGYVGSLDLQPHTGPIGTAVTVQGKGLPANQEFDLVWRTVKGHWNASNGEYRGRTYEPAGYVIAKVTSDADGSFTAKFNAPDDFGFWHDVTVQQGDRLYTKAAFNIEMTVDISPKSGPVGTPITVDVKGIGWKKLQNSWLMLYDNKFTGWMSSVNNAGSAHFTIPAAGKPGVHLLEVLHGGFTFPYRNMQQSPEPNRPTFAIPFEITKGEPVLPAPVAEQVQAEVRGLPAQGDLTVEPAFATVGQPLTVSASGFEPGKTYALNWSTVTGNRVSGSGWEERERVIAEAKADASGKLVYSFATPDDLGGTHNLRVDAGGSDKKGAFWLAPSAFPLDKTQGPAGTAFTIHLKGVGWTETANIYAINYDNNYIGYSCGFNSQGDVVINLHATGEPGWHFIDLYPAVYKGKERGPLNFRLPQLTYADDHPGEDLPRFSFAFKVIEPTTD